MTRTAAATTASVIQNTSWNWPGVSISTPSITPLRFMPHPALGVPSSPRSWTLLRGSRGSGKCRTEAASCSAVQYTAQTFAPSRRPTTNNQKSILALIVPSSTVTRHVFDAVPRPQACLTMGSSVLLRTSSTRIPLSRLRLRVHRWRPLRDRAGPHALSLTGRDSRSRRLPPRPPSVGPSPSR